MRIVGGTYRGAKLSSPGSDGGGKKHLRPTSDRVREALFNLLAHGDYPPIEGARVLDLFAGTGALGLEAMSRGASTAVFIDDGVPSRGLIRQNIEKLGLIGTTKLWRRDATRLGPCRGEGYGYVFADPPYGSGLGERALQSAVVGGWIAKEAVIVLEESADAEFSPPDTFEQVSLRRYGDTQIAIFRHRGQTSLGAAPLAR